MRAQVNQTHLIRMRRALALAARGLKSTIANPRVGCVLVRDGRVIGEGWHKGDGCLHAEAAALADANARGESTSGATAYVTLEPCCHTGRQPPCSEALIKAEISRVIASGEDPHPAVAGKGFAALRRVGIEVETGLLADRAEALNQGFFHRQRHALPWVTLKLAVSLDGRIAAADGGSRYVSCDASRADAMRWRARSQAILTSSATVLADNPQHTVRGVAGVTQPDLWLLDSRGRASVGARVFAPVAHQSGLPQLDKRRVYWVRPPVEAGLPEHVEVIPTQGQVNLTWLLKRMAEQGVNEVLTECGGGLAGALLEAGLVNRLLVYQAPVLLGHKGLPMARLNCATMADRFGLGLLESRRLGVDTRLIYAPGSPGA